MKKTRVSDEDYLVSYNLSRVERELTTDRIENFIRTYVYGINVRPLLGTAGIGAIPQAELFAPYRCWKIFLNENCHDDQVDLANSILHELLHIVLHIVGIEDHLKYEDQISQCAEKLAKKFPEVVGMCEQIFSGLTLSLPLNHQQDFVLDWYVELQQAA